MTSPRLMAALVPYTAVAQPVWIGDQLVLGELHAARIVRAGRDYSIATRRSATIGVVVNGKAVKERVLRDGDEVVVGDEAWLFRLGFQGSDLARDYQWHRLDSAVPPLLAAAPQAVFVKLYAKMGFDAPVDAETPIEDWRDQELTGQYFGFGRRRVVTWAASGRQGLDHSQWDLVQPSGEQLYRERWTTIGLPGLVMKWQVTKPECKPDVLFEHQLLLVGGRDAAAVQLGREHLEKALGESVALELATGTEIRSLHEVDRIMRIPRQRGEADPEGGVYHTITRR